MNCEYSVPTAPVKETETLSPRRFFLFSLRALLITLSIVAAIFGCIVAAPLFAVVACLVYVGISCALLTALFYGKGWIKGFAIGFTVPHLLGYFIALNASPRPEGVLFLFIVANAVSGLTGLTTSILHSYLKIRDFKIAVPPIPFLRDWLSND